jgi:hypothetical protein
MSETLKRPSLAELGGIKKEDGGRTAAIAVAGAIIILIALILLVLAFKVLKEDCKKPNVKVGGECCVDANKNGVCDKNEKQTSTTTVPQSTTTVPPKTSTTSSTSTTTSSTTTTTVIIRCRTNADCGARNETRVCMNGDVYILRVSPRCTNPGTPTASCIISHNKLDYPEETCTTRCENGECVH